MYVPINYEIWMFASTLRCAYGRSIQKTKFVAMPSGMGLLDNQSTPAQVRTIGSICERGEEKAPIGRPRLWEIALPAERATITPSNKLTHSVPYTTKKPPEPASPAYRE